MSYSYPEANSNKPRRSHLPGFIALVLVISAGGLFVKSTLAANINLSSGRSIEFGQAVSQAVACSGDQNVTVTPKSSFVNASNASGTHYLGAVTVANIPTSCANKDFVISVYPDTATAAGVIFGSTRTLRFYFGTSGDAYSSSDINDLKVTSETQACASPASGSCRSITLAVVNPSLRANPDSKITLMTEEKSSWSCSKGGTCVAGETGPGGGVVFYVAPTTFTSAAPCGSNCKYLEAARSTWNSVAGDPRPRLATCNSSVNANLTEIGQGFGNTRDLDCQDATTGRTLVWGVSIGEKTDWYIPAVKELLAMCTYSSTTGVCGANSSKTPSLNLTAVNAGNYFASNSKASAPGYMQYFQFFNPATNFEVRATDGNKSLRPIRAFAPA
jgi:hypothetical protein